MILVDAPPRIQISVSIPIEVLILSTLSCRLLLFGSLMSVLINESWASGFFNLPLYGINLCLLRRSELRPHIHWARTTPSFLVLKLPGFGRVGRFDALEEIMLTRRQHPLFPTAGNGRTWHSSTTSCDVFQFHLSLFRHGSYRACRY